MRGDSAQITTSKPCRANWRASSKPMPDDAPVTTESGLLSVAMSLLILRV